MDVLGFRADVFRDIELRFCRSFLGQFLRRLLIRTEYALKRDIDIREDGSLQ